MRDAVSPAEAVQIVARRMVESAAKNGQPLTQEQAAKRVAVACERGDRKRDNANR